jgi:hypothetical protein
MPSPLDAPGGGRVTASTCDDVVGKPSTLTFSQALALECRLPWPRTVRVSQMPGSLVRIIPSPLHGGEYTYGARRRAAPDLLAPIDKALVVGRARCAPFLSNDIRHGPERSKRRSAPTGRPVPFREGSGSAPSARRGPTRAAGRGFARAPVRAGATPRCAICWRATRSHLLIRGRAHEGAALPSLVTVK